MSLTCFYSALILLEMHARTAHVQECMHACMHTRTFTLQRQMHARKIFINLWVTADDFAESWSNSCRVWWWCVWVTAPHRRRYRTTYTQTQRQRIQKKPSALTCYKAPRRFKPCFLHAHYQVRECASSDAARASSLAEDSSSPALFSPTPGMLTHPQWPGGKQTQPSTR